jgi:hypothetical protein
MDAVSILFLIHSCRGTAALWSVAKCEGNCCLGWGSNQDVQQKNDHRRRRNGLQNDFRNRTLHAATLPSQVVLSAR